MRLLDQAEQGSLLLHQVLLVLSCIGSEQVCGAIVGLDSASVARFFVHDDCGLAQCLPCLISVHRHGQVPSIVVVSGLHDAHKLIRCLECCISLGRFESSSLVVLTAILLDGDACLSWIDLNRFVHFLLIDCDIKVVQRIIHLCSLIEGCGRVEGHLESSRCNEWLRLGGHVALRILV